MDVRHKAEDATRDALREAASRILRREGVRALSLRRVAREAGVTTMGIYSRFGGKDGLLDALHAEGFELLSEAQASLPEQADPLEAIVAHARAHRRMARDHQAHYQVMFERSTGFEPSSVSRERATGSLEALRAKVSDAVSRGALDGDPESIARAVFAQVHGTVALTLAGIEGGDGEAGHDAALRALLRGFAP
ncbi:MAG: TetR/AcrR family transcriptional regulator [Myxococcota bacterium]